MRLFNSLLFMSCMGLVLSCSKSNDDAKRAQLKKVTETNYDQQTEYGYKNGVLMTMRSSNLASTSEYSYQYPADGLSAIQVQETPKSSGGVNKKYQVAFKYENQGRLSEAILTYDNATPPGENDITRYEFFYTGNDTKISSSIAYSQKDGSEVNNSRSVFKYDARGNVSEYILYKWEQNNWVLYIGTRFTYANVANPTFLLGSPVDICNYQSKDLWIESNIFATHPAINVIPKISRSYLVDFSGRVVAVKYPGNTITYQYSFN